MPSTSKWSASSGFHYWAYLPLASQWKLLFAWWNLPAGPHVARPLIKEVVYMHQITSIFHKKCSLSFEYLLTKHSPSPGKNDACGWWAGPWPQVPPSRFCLEFLEYIPKHGQACRDMCFRKDKMKAFGLGPELESLFYPWTTVWTLTSEQICALPFSHIQNEPTAYLANALRPSQQGKISSVAGTCHTLLPSRSPHLSPLVRVMPWHQGELIEWNGISYSMRFGSDRVSSCQSANI